MDKPNCPYVIVAVFETELARILDAGNPIALSDPIMSAGDVSRFCSVHPGKCFAFYLYQDGNYIAFVNHRAGAETYLLGRCPHVVVLRYNSYVERLAAVHSQQCGQPVETSDWLFAANNLQRYVAQVDRAVPEANRHVIFLLVSDEGEKIVWSVCTAERFLNGDLSIRQMDL